MNFQRFLKSTQVDGFSIHRLIFSKPAPVSHLSLTFVSAVSSSMLQNYLLEDLSGAGNNDIMKHLFSLALLKWFSNSITFISVFVAFILYSSCLFCYCCILMCIFLFVILLNVKSHPPQLLLRGSPNNGHKRVK